MYLFEEILEAKLYAGNTKSDNELETLVHIGHNKKATRKIKISPGRHRNVES